MKRSGLRSRTPRPADPGLPVAEMPSVLYGLMSWRTAYAGWQVAQPTSAFVQVYLWKPAFTGQGQTLGNPHHEQGCNYPSALGAHRTLSYSDTPPPDAKTMRTDSFSLAT
jgi:hypothetical protein